MRRFWICAFAALAGSTCLALGQDQPHQYSIRVLLQRPGLPDAKPAVRTLEDQEATIQWGQSPADTVTLKFKAHSHKDQSVGVLFTVAQQDGSFTAAMPTGAFNLTFSKNAKGATVAHLVQEPHKGFDHVALGSNWDRFVGWRVTVEAMAEPGSPAAP